MKPIATQKAYEKKNFCSGDSTCLAHRCSLFLSLLSRCCGILSMIQQMSRNELGKKTR